MYKIFRSKINSSQMPKIDGKISTVRNTIYHHNNVLIENKQSTNPNVDEEHIKELSKYPFSFEEINYLRINYKYNTLRLIIDMIECVNNFLSLDASIAKRKEYMLTKLEENLNKSKHYYSKLKSKDWVDYYFKSLYVMIKSLS